MTELSDRNQPVDAITMTDALRTRGKLEAIGGPAYIAELAACVPTAANVAHYARIVREKAVLRALASTAPRRGLLLARNVQGAARAAAAVLGGASR